MAAEAGRKCIVLGIAALGASILAAGAPACTFDYQGAVARGGSSAGSGGDMSGSSSSPPPPTATSSGSGQGGQGGQGGAAASSSGGGPVTCPPLAGTLTEVTNDTTHGHDAWTNCGSGDLTDNLAHDDLDVDCVIFTASAAASNWLHVKFAFPLPADAAVSKIDIAIRRGTTIAGGVEDKRAWIDVLQFENPMSTPAPWQTGPEYQHYTFDHAYAPGEVTGASLVLQVVSLTNQKVKAKVGYATATVTYASSACP